MTSVIYASLSAFIIIWLSMNVINVRTRNKIRDGDGDNKELQISMAAQSTATEYIPIALLLLFALEYNHGNIWLVHVSGIALITGRLIHAQGLLSEKIKRRVLGMQITIYTIISLAIINFVYLPYDHLFSF